MEQLLTLFWVFLKINLLSTSGAASTGLLYNEAVGRFLTEDQFVQAVGLATLLPGSDALQLAMFVGYSVAGIAGGPTAAGKGPLYVQAPDTRENFFTPPPADPVPVPSSAT